MDLEVLAIILPDANSAERPKVLCHQPLKPTVWWWPNREDFGERDLDEDPDGHAKYMPSLTSRFSPRLSTLAILHWVSFSYEAK